MALVVNDRVKETSTTTGTGTFDLAGAVSGFESFVAGIGGTNTTYYAIVNENGEFEVGLGTVTDAATDTLSRDTIISSSNSDSAVDFSAGTKNVFCTLPASKAVIEDGSSNVTLPADLSVGDDLTVEGGVIEFKSNSGSPAALRMYCEVSNAHYQTLVPQPHSAAATNTLRLPDSGDSGTQDLVAVDITQTLTNKTLTTPVISSISNSGTLTLPTGTDTLVGRATTDTLTNKSIDAGQLTGTIADARFPATLPAADGSALTDLNASNVASGTLSSDRLPTVPTTKGGTGLTSLGTANQVIAVNSGATALEFQTVDLANLNASNLTSGTVPDARFPATLPALNGSALTDLNASNLASGTVPIARIDLNLLTTSTSDGDGDFFVVVDSAGAEKKLTKANINNSGFNNDAGFTTNTGTVTSVSGGNGLTGTVTTSGSLAVGAGTGIDVAADSISVDVSDFMSNGSNNRVLTATGADAMNAEANLTFDGSTLAVTGALTTTGNTTTDHVLPNANDTYDLGASGNVWRNVYTGDLHLSNEAKEEGNAVDGTKGNWTIQEGAEHLYILNNKSGKKYRFKLEEM